MSQHLCKCGEPRRPRQRNCRKCHAAYSKRTYENQATELKILRKLVADHFRDDPETKSLFEAEFFTRFVIVFVRPDDRFFEDFAGYVVGFRPNRVLLVQNCEGAVYEVKLEQCTPERSGRKRWITDID